MPKNSSIVCHECGADMNLHGLKVDRSLTAASFEQVDSEAEGVLVEFHACPKCGNAATRTRPEAAPDTRRND